MTKLDELIAVAAKLRGPGGCPWDAEQTHQSLVKYLIEEVYELVDAIESGNRDEVLEELGDVLYHVVFHSDLAEHGSRRQRHGAGNGHGDLFAAALAFGLGQQKLAGLDALRQNGHFFTPTFIALICAHRFVELTASAGLM